MKGPQGQWRPNHEIASAIHTMKIATGEIRETLADEQVEKDSKKQAESAKE